MEFEVNCLKGRIVDWGHFCCLVFLVFLILFTFVDIVGNLVPLYTLWRRRQDRAVHYSVLSLSISHEFRLRECIHSGQEG